MPGAGESCELGLLHRLLQLDPVNRLREDRLRVQQLNPNHPSQVHGPAEERLIGCRIKDRIAKLTIFQ